MMKMTVSLFSVPLCFLLLVVRRGDAGDAVRSLAASCSKDGKSYERWTRTQVRSGATQNGKCLVILYNTVYDLKGFADIHKGGSWSILRNCGRDVTRGFEALQCIKDVPDHTIGILNMVNEDIVGVLSGGDACPITRQDYSQPDFAACDVYDRVKCDSLASMPQEGKWSEKDITDTTVYDTRKCLVSLYGNVYDLDAPPVQGGPTFANKHGGGREPVMKNCNRDITEIFEDLVKKDGIPDHTRGSLNAIIGYQVGVIEGGESDPCVLAQAPPEPDCSKPGESGDIPHFTMAQVRNYNEGCAAVVWGKVYKLDEFAKYHYGGTDEILEHCGEDLTGEFFEESVHTIVHLATIQNFQIGVIKDSISDPCSDNYEQDPTPPNGGGGGGSVSGSGDDSGDDSNSGDNGPPKRLLISSPKNEQTVRRTVIVKTGLQGIAPKAIKQVTFTIKRSGGSRLLAKRNGGKRARKISPRRNKRFGKDKKSPFQARLVTSKYRNGEYLITAVANIKGGGRLVSRRKIKIKN